MSETTYIDTIWSGPRAVMETLVATLSKDKRVAAVAPLADVTFGGVTRTVARIRSTEALGDPPQGVSTETETVGAIAVGVFMAGPVKPTPLEWMDRLPVERQVALLEALNATPQGRHFALRLTAAREIDPKHPDTVAGVNMLVGAGVLLPDEAAALLR